MHPHPIPGSTSQIADVLTIRGDAAERNSAPDLLVEVPHGATTADFDALAAELESPLPNRLVDFFHVNTDVGAFELAVATAEHLVAAIADRCVVIVRSRIPRTFIDCNRRIDADPEAFRQGGVTPGSMPWISSSVDQLLLRRRHDEYLTIVREAATALRPGGATLLLHTYAPRTIGVEVDENIVANLHHAYRPEIIETWPLRPELDVISRDADGRSHAPGHVVDALRASFADLEWTVGDSATYPMHPSALAWDHVTARPDRVLCLEVRRDLLADPFEPFVEMRIGESKIAMVVTRLAKAIGHWGYEGGRI